MFFLKRPVSCLFFPCFVNIVVFLLICRLMAKAATMPVVPACAQVTPDTISAVIYTSGTTGNPKGVELSHRNIVTNVSLTGELWRPSGMLEGQTTLAFLPWAHVFGMTCELHQFNAGGTIFRACLRYFCLSSYSVVPKTIISTFCLFSLIFSCFFRSLFP